MTKEKQPRDVRSIDDFFRDIGELAEQTEDINERRTIIDLAIDERVESFLEGFEDRLKSGLETLYSHFKAEEDYRARENKKFEISMRINHETHFWIDLVYKDNKLTLDYVNGTFYIGKADYDEYGDFKIEQFEERKKLLDIVLRRKSKTRQNQKIRIWKRFSGKDFKEKEVDVKISNIEDLRDKLGHTYKRILESKAYETRFTAAANYHLNQYEEFLRSLMDLPSELKRFYETKKGPIKKQ